MQLPKELNEYNLVRPSVPKFRRLVAAIEADEKAGKSRLGFSMPKPLLYVNLDQNAEGLEEKYEGEDVFIYNVDMPEEVEEKADFATFKKMQKLVLTSITKQYFRSIYIDTWDQVWELARRGYLGKEGMKFGGVSQSDYTAPNGAMRKIIRAAKNSKFVNLGLACRTTDERKESISQSGKKVSAVTGNRVMTGWKPTRFEAQVIVRLEKDKAWVCEICGKRCAKPKTHRLQRFTATITDCTANERAEGEVLVGLDINWANIGMAVFPNTAETPEVWEDGVISL